MGVGVSYTGYDGATRRANVSGVEDVKSVLGETERAGRVAMNDAEGILARARKPRNRLDMFGENSGARTLPGGSVVYGEDGLCLRGEETSPLVEGKKMYASVNGRKGFFALGEIDPADRGALVGIGDRRDQYTPEVSEKTTPNGVPWSITVGSRIVMREDKDAKMVVFYEFYKEMYFSAEGRVIGVSGERNRVIGEVLLKPAQFCVRPEFDENGVLSKLSFGTDEDLGKNNYEELDTVKTVETVQCPNA